MEGESDNTGIAEDSYYKYNELMSSMESDFDNKTFDNFFGAQHTVETLKSFLVLPLKFPQLYKGARSPSCNSFLLFGAPGCGKSHLLYATATAAAVKLFVFHSWNLCSGLYGRGEKAAQCIGTVFGVARNNRPCILCFEDVEVMSRDETHFQKGRSALLTELRSVPQMEGVIITAMTLAPWKIDAELRRQFRPIHVNLPDQEARSQILQSLLSCSNHHMKSEDFDEIAGKTQGFTGSDLNCLVAEAKMKPIRTAMTATHFKKVKAQEVETASQNDPVSTISSEAVISDTRPGEGGQCSQRHFEVKKTVEKLTACEPEDEGSIPMTVYDIPEDAFILEEDITVDFIRQALHQARPSVSDEDISKFTQFESEFCCQPLK